MSKLYSALESEVNQPSDSNVLQIVDSMSDGQDYVGFEQYFQDTLQLDREVENKSSDLARCTEVTMVLEELVKLVEERVGEATPSESRLIELVGEMAVAGTPVDPEDVVPSMEAYAVGSMSMVKVKENIKRLWEYAKQLMARLIAKINQYFKSLFKTAVSLTVRISNLEGKLKDLDTTKFKLPELKLNEHESNRLALTTKPTTFSEVVNNFKRVDQLSKYFYGDYHAYLTNRCTSLREAVDDFDLANPDKTLSLLVQRLQGKALPKLLILPMNNRLPIMGHHEVIGETEAASKRKSSQALSPGHYLELSRKAVIEIHRNDDHESVGVAKLSGANLGDIKTTLGSVKKFVQSIENFTQHPLVEIENYHADLIKALDRLNTKLIAQAEKDHGVRVAEHAFNLISSHAKSVTEWIDQPLRAFSTYGITLATAMVSMLEHAVVQGDVKEEPAKP